MRSWSTSTCELRDLGLTVADIRELASTGEPIGPHLAELPRRSHARVSDRIAELRQTLRRIEEFEAAYQDELADDDDSCWNGDPRRAASA